MIYYLFWGPVGIGNTMARWDLFGCFSSIQLIIYYYVLLSIFVSISIIYILYFHQNKCEDDDIFSTYYVANAYLET